MNSAPLSAEAAPWAWRRAKGRRPLPILPPLLLWVHRLAQNGLVPHEAVSLTLHYLETLQDMRKDPHLSPRFRTHTNHLLRGTANRAVAHGFLHMVLEDLAAATATT